MFIRYKLLSSGDSASEHSPDPGSIRRRFYRMTVLTVLTIANVCVLGLSMAIWRTIPTSLATPSAAYAQPSELARVESLPTKFIPFYWNTPWGAPNASEADRLWDNINTAHGHIAVDHEFAAENHWPPSMDIPGKPGKGLYLLQAYHQLHCLVRHLFDPEPFPPSANFSKHLLQRIVRAAYLTLKRQELPIFPSDHVLHCFDALRQHIMCHADNTPLYGHGHGIAGDGQIHQCRDWNALRDYATKNTACFRDGKPGMSFEDRFGVCDDGTDGLE